MRTPIFVRPLTDTERAILTTGLHSPDAFTLRRCQILLASARGERAPQIATHLGCDDQTVRNAIHAFNRSGLDTLSEGSSRPHRIAVAFDSGAAERLRALLHQSPRAFNKPTSLWTLDLAAEICFTEGITDEQVTGETIRVTLRRLGVRWQRAKHWITSPDPEYARKKVARPADPVGDGASRLGARLRGRGLVESDRAPALDELGRGGRAAALGRADAGARRSRSEGVGLLRPLGAGMGRHREARRADVAALRGRATGERDHDAVPRLVLPAVGQTRKNRTPVGLGQRELARQ